MKKSTLALVNLCIVFQRWQIREYIYGETELRVSTTTALWQSEQIKYECDASLMFRCEIKRVASSQIHACINLAVCRRRVWR